MGEREGTWNLSGTYFESCNCEATCPCVVLNAPTHGECTLLVAWHIDRGTFEGTRLDGLNVALAVHSPGHMVEVPWRVALYLDDRASPTQREALIQIFAGQAGGHPARLAGHIGEVLGVTDAPIEYRAEGRRRALRIGEMADVAIQAIDGQGGCRRDRQQRPAVHSAWSAGGCRKIRASALPRPRHGVGAVREERFLFALYLPGSLTHASWECRGRREARPCHRPRRPR